MVALVPAFLVEPVQVDRLAGLFALGDLAGELMVRARKGLMGVLSV
jgi:hypothetical protein